MIVYETKDEFVLVEQHNHALLSAEFAKRWAYDHLQQDERRESVLLGIAEHDRGWIDIDQSPLWNDAAKRPYSFMDYPWIPKLAFYKQGIDELMERDLYAALLASLHYSSFFKGATHERAIRFATGELERQEKLKQTLGIVTDESRERLLYHFKLLQFCDDLSLYLCMQKPGISKSDESDWYMDGFDQLFDFSHGEKIVTEWKDSRHVEFNHFPFEAEFETELSLKVITKESIEHHGMTKAYELTPYTTQTIRFMAQKANH